MNPRLHSAIPTTTNAGNVRTQAKMHKRAITIIAAVYLFALGSGLQLSAQTCTTSTCNAASTSQAAVLAALPSSGNTNATVVVNIPSGTSAWSTPLVYTVPAGVTSLTIQGATACSGSGDPLLGGSVTCTDHTTIQDSASSSGVQLIDLTVPTGKFLRITGMTFAAGSRSVADHGQIVVACAADTTGNGQFRYDHNHSSGVSTFMTTEDCFGVADHNLIQESGGNLNYLHIWNPSYNQGSSAGYGDGSWAANTDYGTSKFFYVEANSLDNGTDDCTFGGRAVVRFNTMTNGSSVQTHPTGGGGADERGCRAYEMYQNNMSAPSPGSPSFNAFFMSSGTAMVWHNTTLNYSNFATIHSMRRDNSTYSESPTPGGWGYCGTDSGLSGAGSAWDQNTPTTTGYACIDQPGRGKGDLITGSAPSWVNSTTGTIAWVHEALDPVYDWANTKNCSGCGGSFWADYNPDVLTSNKDFYLWCDPSSGTGCTSTFNGTVGTGQGVRSSRPATCTTGVAYFSTDQGSWNSSGNGAGSGVLDKCTGTNTWTSASYTPFAYPHPLTGGVTTYTLSTATAGTGTGTITGCPGNYAFGDPYTCSVSASAGSTISSVTGCGGSGTTTYAGAMPNSPCTVTATFQGTAATPAFSPTAGSYTGPQFVTISTSTPGATIYYTVDGSTPTTSSAIYKVPLHVFATQTLKALAVATGYTNSSVGSAAFTVGKQKTRFSMMRSSPTMTPVPFPVDDRMQPSSGVRISNIEGTRGTYNWTTYDQWVSSTTSHASKVVFTYQARPNWMTGLGTTTDGPPTDLNTSAACQNVLTGTTTTDCSMKEFTTAHMMHVTGLSSQPVAPVACPNLDELEPGNEVNSFSGSSAIVGWSGTPAQFVKMSDDIAEIKAKWCTSATKMQIGSFSAVVGSNGTGNPQYDVYAAAILALIPQADQGLYQGISFHNYSARDNFAPEPPPTSVVAYSGTDCTSGNTPSNKCYVPIYQQVGRLQTVALNQAGNVSWSAHLPINITEGGLGKIFQLNGDNDFGIAYVSEFIVLTAADPNVTNGVPPVNSMLYLADDHTNGTPCASFADNWGCYWTGPWYDALQRTTSWLSAATTIGAASSASITGGTGWVVPLNGGTSEIAFCAVQNPATCTKSTSFTHKQDISGTITSLSGTVTLNSTASLLFNGATAATPTFLPAAGSYGSTQSVAISTTSGTVICYNTTGSSATNGTTGCTTGTLYSGPVSVSTSETLYAVAGGTGLADSPVGSAAYVINGAASTPTFSPVAGSYGPTQSVTISSSTSGSTLCYTSDGSTPTANGAGACTHGTTYSGAVTVSISQTLKAIASKVGFLDSGVGSAAYVINGAVAIPTFSPAAGTYTSTQSVTISDSTSGASIFYTTDGSTPTTSSTPYSGAISVAVTTTVKAIASKSGFSNSAVGSALYTITAPPTVHVTLTGTQTFSGTGKVQ